MTKTQERPRRDPRLRKDDGKGRLDGELIRAKGGKAELVLALPTHYTDEDGKIECYIREVDTYAIKVTKNLKTGRDFWIGKAFIVQTTIL